MKYQTPKPCQHCGTMMRAEDLLKGHRNNKEWTRKRFDSRKCSLAWHRARREKKRKRIARRKKVA